MNKELISFDNVNIYYENYNAVKNVSFKIYENDFLNIVGPNGAGKTTLIKAITNEQNIASGKISIFTEKLGYVPQRLTQKRNFPITVLEFIYTGFINQKFKISKEDKELILKWIQKMELNQEDLNKNINELSGGELQRVYFVRSLISNPEVLILDEPASALDPNFRKKFYEILKEVKQETNLAIIHITHDLNEEIFDNSKVMLIDQEIKFMGSYEAYRKASHEVHHHE